MRPFVLVLTTLAIANIAFAADQHLTLRLEDGLPEGNAMARYCESYTYDAVGNFLKMSHHDICSSAASWSRRYDYLETSLIEDGSNGAPLKVSNRLSRTMLNPAGNAPQPEISQHDAHGNMIRMPHLPLIQWDYRDQLQATSQQIVNNGIPETTYYVYDSGGQRVRKVTERAVTGTELASGKQPTRMKERILTGRFRGLPAAQRRGRGNAGA